MNELLRGRWFFLALVVATGCTLGPLSSPEPPADFVRDEGAEQAPSEGPIEVVVVDPTAVLQPMRDPQARRDGESRLEGPFDKATIKRLQSLADNQPPNPDIAGKIDSSLRSPTPMGGFDHLDFNTSGQNFVPPDTELAVGPNHLVSVVNDAMYITDTMGTMLAPPISLPSFFGAVPGCTNLFDPNVLYDEQLDRFVVGIDANGTGYCVAMTQSPDPMLPWNSYSFATVPAGTPQDFFDYPHAGVGDMAIYMGANIYDSTGSTFKRAEVWAIDKNTMASGMALTMPVSQVVTGGFTPQPMNAHGWLQGTWPVGQVHVVVANQYSPAYSADLLDVWTWFDPLGANSFLNLGFVDLAAAAGGAGAYPVNALQNGGSNIQANDWRILDNEYRNGSVWVSQTIACNPGAGTVDCVRWAEIDPQTPAVVQAGVLGIDGEYLIFPDLAVNHCDDLTIGYTKTSSVMYPEVWATGRLGIDPPGNLAPDQPLLAATVPYSSWDTPTYRWGDYSGATSGPDGASLWYIGEYSKPLTFTPPGANWGTWVNEFSSACEADLQTSVSDGVDQIVPGAQVTYTITVLNAGRGDSLGTVISDMFPADIGGVTWTCADQTGPPTSVCGAPSGSGDLNLMADLEVGASIVVTATGTVSPAATGTLANTAMATNNGIQDLSPGNATDTDVDTLTPSADLSVSVADVASVVLAGSSTTYTVTVANNGLSDAPAAFVSDVVPSGLTVSSWSCIASGGAACGAGSGSGGLSDTPFLPAGTSVTYQVVATIDGSASGQLTYTVNASPGPGVTDPTPGNDSDSDTNMVSLFCDDFESGDMTSWSASVP